MAQIGLWIGLFLLGTMLGLCGTLLFIRGWCARGSIEKGQPIFGKAKNLDAMVNTDRGFVDEIRQDRFQKGQEPYINEG